MRTPIHSNTLLGKPYHSHTLLHSTVDSLEDTPPDPVPCAGQVEHNRLNIPRATPVAVQQWEGLIAINYPARAAGITRHMRVGEATKICPDLQAVHVQTLGTAHCLIVIPKQQPLHSHVLSWVSAC